MAISGVSFGAVVMATGPKSKMDKLNRRVAGSRRQPVIVEDVTSRYQYAYSAGGLLSTAVQKKGDKVSMFITREDTDNYTKKKEGWQTLDDVLAQMTDYVDLRKTSVDNAEDFIFAAGTDKKR